MYNKSLITVNIAVLLFGCAGLFAKWIALPAILITLGRVVFSSVTLFLFARFTGQSIQIQRKKHLLLLLLAGALLALHWWSFLESIQRSSVAIGTITFSTFPLFVTFLEPLFFRKKLQLRAVIMAILILAGVVITIPDFTVNSRYLQGILIGMGSAVSYAVLTTMNKQFTQTYTGSIIAMYEQGIAALLLLPSLLFIKASFTLPDIALLALLGVLMTAVAHTLFISSLKGISVQTAGICSSMETVYGILLAMLVLGEIPSLRECIGAVVILFVVIYSQKTEAAAG